MYWGQGYAAAIGVRFYYDEHCSEKELAHELNNKVGENQRQCFVETGWPVPGQKDKEWHNYMLMNNKI